MVRRQLTQVVPVMCAELTSPPWRAWTHGAREAESARATSRVGGGTRAAEASNHVSSSSSGRTAAAPHRTERAWPRRAPVHRVGGSAWYDDGGAAAGARVARRHSACATAGGIASAGRRRVADGAIGAAVGVGGAAPRGLFTLPSLGGGVKKQLDMVKMVAHPPWHMYEVVADVAAYSRFLPFCTRSVLCRRYPNGDFDAQLAIGFQLFHETYTSRVTVDPRQRTVSATLVESAIFRKLKSHWRLLPVDGSPNRCRIEFHVEFEVKAENVLQGAAINAIFEDLSRQQMDAFAARASAVPYSLDDAHE